MENKKVNQLPRRNLRLFVDMYYVFKLSGMYAASTLVMRHKEGKTWPVNHRLN